MTVWVHRTMIVPATWRTLAQQLCAGLAGPSGTGMFEVDLGPTVGGPVTHGLSTGLIFPSFAALMPLDGWDDEAGTNMTNRIALIRVRFQERDDFIYASSEDVPGLHVAGRFRESVEEDVRNIIQQLFRLQRGLNVRVEQTVNAADMKTPSPSGEIQLDGGVRGKMIDIRDPAKWRVYRVPDGEHLSLDNWLDAHDMQGYDHLGLLGIMWRPAGHSRSRKFCSEAVAEHLMLATPELYDPRTLKDLVERFFPRVAWSDGQWLPAVQLQQQPLDISGSDAETVPAS